MAIGHFAPSFANEVLSALLRGQSLPGTPRVWVGLLTELPDESGTGAIEVQADGYERQVLLAGEPAMGQVRNSQGLTYPIAEQDWGLVLGYAFYQTQTGGEPFMWAELTPAKHVGLNDRAEFRPGELSVRLA